MRGVNKAIIIGPVTSQINFKKIPNNISVCKFKITTSHTRSNGTEKLEHHNIEVWDKLADLCNKHLSTGRIIYIEGRNETEIWGEGDNKKYKTKVVGHILEFLDDKPKKDSKEKLKDQRSEYKLIDEINNKSTNELINILDKINF